MKKINEHIENAFDLSYLDFPSCPSTQIKTIGVLGGGTAGYLTALALRKFHPQLKVSIIESSKIPVIGVGESTTTEIVPFLHKALELDPEEFFREVEPTLKLGIRFDWGCPGDYKFNFNFFAGHQQESYFYENSILNANWASVLMTENKLPILKHPDGSLQSFLSSIPFSYHIDNKKLIHFLNKKVAASNTEMIDGEVSNVNLDEQGFISSLETKEGHKLAYDLYIDCSGFRTKLLGETLKTEFFPFDDTLITDKAMTFNLPNKGVVNCYTSVITMNSGWCWQIPMREEIHCGYVHSSKYCDEATALAEIREKFGDVQDFKIVHFRSGRHTKAWNKNVCAIGNAYAFIEPLESTAIQTAIHSIMTLCRLMPNSTHDQVTIEGFNQEITAMWDTFRWFLGLHYRFNKQKNTPFWNWCNKNVNIGDAQMILDLFNERTPLSAGNFGTNSPYTSLEALVFNSYSYDTLIFGQKIVKNPIQQPKMSREDYFSKCASYQALSKLAISQGELFEQDYLFEQGLLEQLFEDPDTWIMETTV